MNSFGNFQFQATDPSFSNSGFNTSSSSTPFFNQSVSSSQNSLHHSNPSLGATQPPNQYIQSANQLPIIQTTNTFPPTNILHVLFDFLSSFDRLFNSFDSCYMVYITTDTSHPNYLPNLYPNQYKLNKLHNKFLGLYLVFLLFSQISLACTLTPFTIFLFILSHFVSK